MGKLAYFFAGQGAQRPGMGRELYDHSAAAAKLFEAAEALRPGTKADCFESDEERLRDTRVTQPCVYVTDLAAAAALDEALAGSDVKIEAAAGFSLGEMAALTWAGAFSFEEGFRLVCERGALMADASAAHPGAMAAVMRLEDEQVEALCGAFTSRLWPVNYNAPGQVVVAGKADALPAFCELVAQHRGVAQPLAVSGAFHTPLMAEAQEGFLPLLRRSNMQAPRLPVYANLTGKPYAPPLAEMLADQMRSPVRWRSAVEEMGRDGFDTFVELGPGKTLSGLCRRILPKSTRHNIEDQAGLLKTAQALQTEM